MAGCPVLVFQVPDTGPVDALPFRGTAKLAVLKDKRVVRQGTFTRRNVRGPECRHTVP